jgi:hypothetical protein
VVKQSVVNCTIALHLVDLGANCRPCDSAIGVLAASKATKPVLGLTVSVVINKFLVASSASSPVCACDGEQGWPITSHKSTSSHSQGAFRIVARTPGLPFRKGSIGTILLLLGWNRPISAEAYGHLLSELMELLAEDGELLLLTANPFGRRRLINLVEPCLKSKGVAAKVRAVSVCTRELLQQMKAFPSQRKLRKLMLSTGFSAMEWFRPLRDDAGYLREIRPLFPSNMEWARYSPLHRGGPFRSSPWFSDEYLIRAAPRALSPPALYQCLQEVARNLKSDSYQEQLIHVNRLLVTPKEKIVIMATLGATRAVIRIPLSEAARRACQRNLRTLNAIANRTEKEGPWPRGALGGRGQRLLLHCRVGSQWETDPPEWTLEVCSRSGRGASGERESAIYAST